MEKSSKILITGCTGMVGKALVSKLKNSDFNLLTPTRAELDLQKQEIVNEYFKAERPEYVFHLAAIVGGIQANQTFPAKFIYENTIMHCNVIHASLTFKVKKLLFPGSACTYPKLATQPIKTASFLESHIEPTNLPYAVAKINGIVMCQAYAKEHGLKVVLPMPTNAYGVGDNFDPHSSHVIPALMQRLQQAKLNGAPNIVLWGSGKPLREFIYVDDLANALIFLMKNFNSSEIINVGTLQEISILDLAKEIASVVGFTGEILTDHTKPDGAPRKCLDATHLQSLGWRPTVALREGLKKMYAAHFK
jgi:GDP-L-fucose synthase